jgi:hypothetical protein
MHPCALLKMFSATLCRCGMYINMHNTVKVGIKELLNKGKNGFKELFTDYQLFYTINLLLNKELLPI